MPKVTQQARGPGRALLFRYCSTGLSFGEVLWGTRFGDCHYYSCLLQNPGVQSVCCSVTDLSLQCLGRAGAGSQGPVLRKLTGECRGSAALREPGQSTWGARRGKEPGKDRPQQGLEGQGDAHSCWCPFSQHQGQPEGLALWVGRMQG